MKRRKQWPPLLIGAACCVLGLDPLHSCLAVLDDGIGGGVAACEVRGCAATRTLARGRNQLLHHRLGGLKVGAQDAGASDDFGVVTPIEVVAANVAQVVCAHGVLRLYALMEYSSYTAVWQGVHKLCSSWLRAAAGAHRHMWARRRVGGMLRPVRYGTRALTGARLYLTMSSCCVRRHRYLVASSSSGWLK